METLKTLLSPKFDLEAIARFLIAGVFFFSAALTAASGSGFDRFVAKIGERGLPFPRALGVLALIFKFAAGMSIADGYLYKEVFSWASIAFIILVTYLYHNPFKQLNEITSFLKNMAIIGGLLLLSKM